MSAISQFRAQQMNAYYIHTKEYKEYVDHETNEAFRVLCDAEVKRDLLAAYAYTSDEAYQMWMEADVMASQADQEYNEWVSEKEEIDDEYYSLLDGIDRDMFRDECRYDRW